MQEAQDSLSRSKKSAHPEPCCQKGRRKHLPSRVVSTAELLPQSPAQAAALQHLPVHFAAAGLDGQRQIL